MSHIGFFSRYVSTVFICVAITWSMNERYVLMQFQSHWHVAVIYAAFIAPNQLCSTIKTWQGLSCSSIQFIYQKWYQNIFCNFFCIKFHLFPIRSTFQYYLFLPPMGHLPMLKTSTENSDRKWKVLPSVHYTYFLSAPCPWVLFFFFCILIPPWKSIELRLISPENVVPYRFANF